MRPKNQLQLSFFLLLIFNLFNLFEVLKIEDTKIATTRNINRQNICSYSNKIFTTKERKNSQQSESPFNNLYSSEEQIRVISSGDFNSLNSKLILMTIPHVIALVISICLIFGLFCCVQWPEKYPLCRVFKDPHKYVPLGFQLKWPAYASIITFLIIIVGSLMALVSAPQIVNDLNNVGCKNATMIDDTLNGRFSVDNQGTFFVGLLPFKSELQTFAAMKISTFFSESSNSFSTANLVRTKKNTIQTTIDTVYTNYNDLAYNSAFSADGNSFNTVVSAFKSLFLGPTSDSTKILGNVKAKLTIIFDEVNLALDNMITSWNNILSVKTQAGVTTQINNLNTVIVTIQTSLEQYLNQIGFMFYNPQKYDLTKILMKAFFGMVFAFALIGLVASIWIAFCNSKACRPILYFACFPLMFLVLIGFCALTYVSFYYPQFMETCYFVDAKLSKGQDAKSLLTIMGMPKFADLMTSCMSDGDGKILNQINPSFSTSFDNINVIAHGTQIFNQKIPSYTASNVDAPFTEGKAVTDKVRKATVWQITDQTAKDHVSKVVGKNYTINTDCDNLNVNGDVWMPSFSLYSCPGGKAKMSPCANLSDKMVCPLGCYEILNTITSPSGDSGYVNTLSTRYLKSTCNYFDYIKRLHEFWNVPRSNRMNTVDSSLDNIKTVVNDYTAKVDSEKASINSFKTALQSNLDSMTNLTSGSFNGMNCRIISESIWQFRDSVCIGLVQSMKTNIICLCLICYGILAMSCFVTCTGVRNYKASKGQIVGDIPSVYQGQMIPSYNQLEQTGEMSRNQ